MMRNLVVPVNYRGRQGRQREPHAVPAIGTSRRHRVLESEIALALATHEGEQPTDGEPTTPTSKEART